MQSDPEAAGKWAVKFTLAYIDAAPWWLWILILIALLA